MATSFNVVGGNGLSVCLEAASLAAALVLSILLLVGNKACYSQSYHFNLLATQTPENAFFLCISYIQMKGVVMYADIISLASSTFPA